MYEFFSGVLFATAKVASITATIFFHIILHPAVLMYHIFLTSIALLLSFYSLQSLNSRTCFDKTQLFLINIHYNALSALYLISLSDEFHPITLLYLRGRNHNLRAAALQLVKYMHFVFQRKHGRKQKTKIKITTSENRKFAICSKTRSISFKALKKIRKWCNK